MVTLNKPSAGDTDWTTEVNDNWTALQNQLVNAFQGRLQRNSDSILSLQRYVGDVVEVNGADVGKATSLIQSHVEPRTLSRQPEASQMEKALREMERV